MTTRFDDNETAIKIQQLQNRIIDPKSHNLSIYNFAKSYRLIDYIVGAIIGLSITYILKGLSDDIINPIITTLIFHNQDFFIVHGIKFNVEKIVSNMVFVILFLLIMYILLKYFFSNLVFDVITENNNVNVATQLSQLQNKIYESESLQILNRIENTIKNK